MRRSLKQGSVSSHWSSGFTLIETLVAISILLLAIVGPITIASRGLQSAFYAKEQLAAVYLAQEGIELVRLVRDTNALQTLDGSATPWLDGLSECTGSAGCGFDMRDKTPVSCSPLSNCRLRYDASIGTSPGMYTRNVGIASPYTRVITIDQISANEAVVTSEVSWQSGLFAPDTDRSVKLQFRIFDQYADF